MKLLIIIVVLALIIAGVFGVACWLLSRSIDRL